MWDKKYTEGLLAKRRQAAAGGRQEKDRKAASGRKVDGAGTGGGAL